MFRKNKKIDEFGRPRDWQPTCTYLGIYICIFFNMCLSNGGKPKDAGAIYKAHGPPTRAYPVSKRRCASPIGRCEIGMTAVTGARRRADSTVPSCNRAAEPSLKNHPHSPVGRFLLQLASQPPPCNSRRREDSDQIWVFVSRSPLRSQSLPSASGLALSLVRFPSYLFCFLPPSGFASFRILSTSSAAGTVTAITTYYLLPITY